MERKMAATVVFLLIMVVFSAERAPICCVNAAPTVRPGSISSSRNPKSPYARLTETLWNPKELKAIISATFTNMLKYVGALPSAPKNGKSVLQFESGYTVETVFDGSKHGIEPYSIQVTPDGDLLILDSTNSNILRTTPPLSRYSKAKLLAGSADGVAGYVDGRPRDARLNHPKGFAVDDKGNIYVADTMNMAIRKISESGVTTIAGGKTTKPGLVDGPSEDARFSNDFDVFYVSSTCSLLVIDRGNQAIREIQLNYDDCAYQYGSNFSAGVLLLGGAAFIGYLIALLQQGVLTSLFSRRETEDKSFSPKRPPGPVKMSGRPPLIPVDGEQDNLDEGWISFWRFFIDVLKSFFEIIGGLFSYMFGGLGFRRQPRKGLHPLRDSLIIDDDVEPQTTPRRKRTVTFREPEVETPSSPPSTEGSDNGDSRPTREYRSPFMHGGPVHQTYVQYEDEGSHDHLRPLRHHTSAPETYFERDFDSSNEVVFGAVQENMAGYRPVEIKPVDYGDPMYSYQNMRARMGAGQYYDY
eukprot:TRINITY_DN283_c0_g1_i1.p1 TRINITY_DN283_c0_g1~~TRINITY_DN283_c0_g1_i1.p1  ORF type:complete len:526 (-),score=67.62 TRINITY_DN283_c0_g1_i1:347-1924(-)